ncbi:MAG: hypothetical protein KKF20_07235, partial [Bacteroidetes bacterium]|nr:hypothetical protein [Bacteroidota bacterium]
MKIAVTSTGGSMDVLVSEQFGRCQYFIIYDTETKNSKRSQILASKFKAAPV